MSKLNDKIAKLFPQATEAANGIIEIEIADAQWHQAAQTLRDDEDIKMDYLVTIVGMDWNDALGCV